MSEVFDVDHVINPELLRMIRQAGGGFHKLGFVPGGDPSGGAGGDPSGGMGGDPSGGMGGPPPGMGGDPSGGGGGPPPSDPRIDQLMQQMQQMQQQMAGGGGAGGGGAGAGGGLKPKIDVNVEIMQIKNILAKIADALNVSIPAQDMVATPEKLTAMANGQSTASGGGGGGGGGGGAIGQMPGIDPMQGAGSPGGEKMSNYRGSYRGNGVAFDTKNLTLMHNKAAAIARLRKRGQE